MRCEDFSGQFRYYLAPCWYLTCVIPGMLWTLDELKRTLINEFPILEIEKGEDFKILFDLFVEWAEILLNYPFCWIWEIMAQNPSLKKFRSYILMWHRTRGVSSHSRGPHRIPEDPIALHTHVHRSSGSTKGIVYQK